jgi:hypothetical protein
LSFFAPGLEQWKDPEQWHNCVWRMMTWAREHAMKVLRWLVYRTNICIVVVKLPFCGSYERMPIRLWNGGRGIEGIGDE